MKRVGMLTIATAGLLIVACSKEPTGQSVAVVNNEEVSQAELNAELEGLNIPASVDKKQAQARLLDRVVDRKLLAQAAIEEGIDRSPEYITRQRRLNEDLLIALMTKRRNDSIKLPSQAEIDKYIAANPGMFQQRAVLALDQIVFDIPGDAAVLNALKDDMSLSDVAATLSASNIQFTRSRGQVDTASLPPEVLKQIDGLSPGEPFLLPANGRIVANVITGRERPPVSTDQTRAFAVEAIKRERLVKMMSDRLAELKRTAKIDYQAGFAPTPQSKSKSPN